MRSLVKNNRDRIFSGLALTMVFCFLAGCSTLHSSRTLVSPRQQHVKRTPLTKAERQKLANIAQNAIGRPRLTVGKTAFRGDCSGTIRAIFARANIPLGGIIKNRSENDVKAIYRYVQRYGQIVKSNPVPGDLVFFHNTYDRSRNGRMNDALTHIGIVEKIDRSTVHFIHHLGQSIIRSRMDLSHPRDTYHPETRSRINHVLRRAQGNYRAYTAAELFAGFGRL